MKNENLLSIGCAACEAGVSVARMEQALREVQAVPVVRLNHVAHYAVDDIERAIECCKNTNPPAHASRPGGKQSEASLEKTVMTTQEKERAIADFTAALKTETDAGKSRSEAVQAVAKKHSAIHAQFLRATHREYRRRR